jgi:hypothetical protein
MEISFFFYREEEIYRQLMCLCVRFKMKNLPLS